MEYDKDIEKDDRRGPLWWVRAAGMWAAALALLLLGLFLLLSEPRSDLEGGAWLCTLLASKGLGVVFVLAFVSLIRN